MLIIRHPESTPQAAKGCAIAIGNFDGVHLGHASLLSAARDYARKNNRPLAVLSFEPHPRKFFAPDLPTFRLTPFQSKYALLRDFGVDYFFCMNFNYTLSRLSPDNFVRDILLAGPAPSAIFVGSDFVFGHARGGNVQTLQGYSTPGKFQVFSTPLLADSIEAISSSRVREALKSGDPALAAQLLGRPFRIIGHVRHGDQLARQLGFPTVNICLRDYQHPMYGVYAVRVQTKHKTDLPGVANIGMRPTIGGKAARCEAHIFDFTGNLYEQRVGVDLIKFIRPEKKFAGIEELKAQIAKDSAEAREILL